MIKVKEEIEKAGLKLNIQKTKIIASGPITLWQKDGETMETVTDFAFLDSKITEDGDCSHEIKSCLLFGRKVMANLYSILKSRDITLPTKVRLVRSDQSLSCVRLFVTPRIAARQASVSITISRSSLKLMSIKSVNNLVFCRLLLLCPQSFPASGSFLMSWLFTSGDGWHSI